MPTYRDKARGCFVFEFDRRIGGRRVRARKLLPRAWTQAKADAFERQESARLYGLASGLEKPTALIEDAVAVYLKHRATELKTGDGIADELALMYWAYHDRALDDLPAVCRKYTEKATKENGEPLAAGTLSNRIRYLVSACRYGWKHHGMGDADPGAGVALPSVSNKRQVYATRAQMLAIARACTCRSSRAAIRISFYSGMRMSEIIRARHSGGNFVLDDTKNGEPRLIPIHPKIRCCLDVPLKDRFWMSKRFKEAARAVGMGYARFHDLRHSAASAMINNKVDLYTVGAVLGHKSATSTKRYAHLATDALRDAVGKIGRKSPTAKITKHPKNVASA